MPAEPVRLASIGLGWWGSVLATAAGAADNARVDACFARSEESREAFAGKHGCRAVGTIDEIWSDPTVDGVLIATPHSTRAIPFPGFQLQEILAGVTSQSTQLVQFGVISVADYATVAYQRRRLVGDGAFE